MKQILTTICVLALCGCANMTSETKAKWSATGSLAANKAFSIGLAAATNLIAGAISPQDEAKKTDWLYSGSFGLFSNMGDIVNGKDIRDVLSVWLPDKPQWHEMTDILANGYTQLIKDAPTVAAKEKVVEKLAAGVQEVASKPKTL